jgi:hypothetical protein
MGHIATCEDVRCFGCAASSPDANYCPHGERLCGACPVEPAPKPEPAPPKVGDTVWLKGWGAGPFLAVEAKERGCLGLTLPDGSSARARYGDFAGTVYGGWILQRDALTTEPPPPPPPSPWTPRLLVQLVAGLAALVTSVAAALVVLS